MSELTSVVTSLTADRRRFEADVSSARADVEDALRERTEAADCALRLQASYILQFELKIMKFKHKNVTLAVVALPWRQPVRHCFSLLCLSHCHGDCNFVTMHATLQRNRQIRV